MKRKSYFSLLELLVVIAIIAILLTLLLPNLEKARYNAKKAVCVSNQRQLIIGLVSYAQRHNTYYPSTGILRSNGETFSQGMRSLANGGELRPLLAPYWGEGEYVGQNGGHPEYTRAGIQLCPLHEKSDDLWHRLDSYLYYFNHTRSEPVSNTIYSAPMTKLHQNYKPYHDEDVELSILVSDPMDHYNRHPQYRRYSNHHELQDDFSVVDHWYYDSHFRSTEKHNYPKFAANFGGVDGSVKGFILAKGSAAEPEGYSKVRTQIVPDFYRVDE